MSIEREVLISILKLTARGPVSYESINKDANVPLSVVQKLLQKLKKEGIVYVDTHFIAADSGQRLKLAVYAMRSGADLERVSDFLGWKEFEDLATIALIQNGYAVNKNLRFKYGSRRWEIDVVGSRKPLIVCIDCKHWTRGLTQASLKRIVKEQVERTSALAKCLSSFMGKIEGASWNTVKLIPAILTLTTARFIFYENVPIVPVLKLRDFMDQLPIYADSLFLIRGSAEESNFGS